MLVETETLSPMFRNIYQNKSNFLLKIWLSPVFQSSKIQNWSLGILTPGINFDNSEQQKQKPHKTKTAHLKCSSVCNVYVLPHQCSIALQFRLPQTKSTTYTEDVSQTWLIKCLYFQQKQWHEGKVTSAEKFTRTHSFHLWRTRFMWWSCTPCAVSSLWMREDQGWMAGRGWSGQNWGAFWESCEGKLSWCLDYTQLQLHLSWALNSQMPEKIV